MTDLDLKRNLSDYEDPKEQMAFLSGKTRGHRITFFYLICGFISTLLITLDALKLVDYTLYECMLPLFIAATVHFISVFMIFAGLIIILGTAAVVSK
jgi:hypothetical protein